MASYQCKYCGKRHNTPETAQECADKNRYSSEPSSMPDAYYLVTAKYNDTEEIVDVVVQLKTVPGGRWNGYRLVNVYDTKKEAMVGVPETRTRDTLLALIAKGSSRTGATNFRKAMLRFGKEKGLCPICAEKMESAKEIFDGIHVDPACYQIAFG